MGLDQSQEEMLLFPGFPGDQQKPQVLYHQRQLGERQHAGGSSPCQLATVALPANRGGRRRESRAWVAKAHIEGHVDTTSSGGEVEGGIPTSRPNIQKLCQGSLDEVVVVHLKQGGSVGVRCHLHRQE